VSVYSHRQWSARTQVDTNGDWFTGLSCSSKSFCLGYNTNYRTFLFGGTNWRPVRGIPMDVNSVECLSKHFCAASSRDHQVAYFQS
jgi:hypothetical protein